MDLRLQLLHRAHRLVRFVGEREEGRLDQHRHRQDSDAEVAEQVVEKVDQAKHRLGDEVEPSPVDEPVEQLDVERVAIAVDDADHLGAGKQVVRLLDRGARRDAGCGSAEVGLVERPRLVGIEKAAVVGRGRVGNDGGSPVLVGDAQPSPGDVFEVLLAVLLDRLVLDFLEPLVTEHADRAFVQDPVAGSLGLADPGHPAEGGDRRGAVAVVGDRVADREHVLVVDRDRAAEHEPGAVVVGQRHRCRAGEFRVRRRRPHRLGPGHRTGALLGDPAEFGEIGVGGAARRQQHDGRALGIDGLVIVGEPQVVDPRPGQVDRSRQGIGGDRHPLRFGERFVAGEAGRRLRPARRRRRGPFRRRRRGAAGALGGRRRRRLLLLLRDLLLLLGLLHLRPGEQDVPRDHHRQRKRESQHQIAVFGRQRGLISVLLPRASAAKPLVKSVTSRSN